MDSGSAWRLPSFNRRTLRCSSNRCGTTPDRIDGLSKIYLAFSSIFPPNLRSFQSYSLNAGLDGKSFESVIRKCPVFLQPHSDQFSDFPAAVFGLRGIVDGIPPVVSECLRIKKHHRFAIRRFLQNSGVHGRGLRGFPLKIQADRSFTLLDDRPLHVRHTTVLPFLVNDLIGSRFPDQGSLFLTDESLPFLKIEQANPERNRENPLGLIFAEGLQSPAERPHFVELHSFPGTRPFLTGTSPTAGQCIQWSSVPAEWMLF